MHHPLRNLGRQCGQADIQIGQVGDSYMTGRFEKDPNVFCEVKCQTPEGIAFDVTTNGWTFALPIFCANECVSPSAHPRVRNITEGEK